MSLINEMLRDLEKRRKREERCLSSREAPVVVNENTPSKFFWWAGWALLVIVIVWFGAKNIPGMRLTEPLVSSLPVQQEIATPAVIKQEHSVSVIPAGVTENIPEVNPLPAVIAGNQNAGVAVTEKKLAELLSLGLVDSKDRTQLSLTFAQLPEYRLLQKGTGATQLVVSFSQTQIGPDFEVPQLTGSLINRVSLVPQKQTLQLLVDLKESARVQSFQFVDNSDQGHRLLIEIVAALPVVKKPQPIATAEATPLVTEQVIEKEVPVVAVVSKNRKAISLDQQSYQAGLKQLKQGRLGAAEASFNQALQVNPTLLDARFQLIKVLQQRRDIATAETVLQQGLVLTPGNLNLRKIYARLLLNAQRQDEAIKLLQTTPLPGIVQDQEYYALLAALYQESKQFEAASAIYAQLLNIRPQVSLWWMGMAISLEQSGSLEKARNAYQKALDLTGLSPDLQSFIESRLQAL